jgi:hypothetical protein
MPETITGNGATFENSASVPVDTDLASASSVKTPFQRMMNNLKHLYDRVFTTGVFAVRSVVDIVALKAIAGMTNGQVAYVRGRGIYLYVDPDTTAEEHPWVVTPTTGTGRWIHENYSIRNVAGGLVATDVWNKIESSMVPMGIVGTYESVLGATVTKSNSGYVDELLVSIPDCQINDVLLVDAFLNVSEDVEPGNSLVEIRVGGTSIVSDYAEGMGAPRLVFTFRHIVGVAGVTEVQTWLTHPMGGGFTYFGQRSRVRVVHIRP